MDEKYTELAIHLQKVDSCCKSNEHRLDDVEAEIGKIQETQITLVKLADGVDKIATQLVDMKEDIKDVKSGQTQLTEKVTILENRPAENARKRMDEILDKLLWLVVGGIAVGLLSAALPGIPW